MAQTPPENGFNLGLDWDTVLVILGAIGLFFRDKIWSFFTERVHRADTREAQKEQQEQKAELTSLEQLLSSHGKLADFTITISSGLLAKIEQGVYKTIEQTRQTNTGLQFDRQHWEQVAERDEEFLRWIQQVDKRLSAIEARLTAVEVALRIAEPRRGPGVHDTQEGGKGVP